MTAPADRITDPAPRDEQLVLDAAASSGRRRAWRVGLLVVASLVILFASLVVTGPFRLFSGHRVSVDYSWAGPVKPGAAVRIAGVVVGAVEAVDFLGGGDAQAGKLAMVRVRIRVEDRAAPVLTDKARFYVTTLGVLGEHYVDVEPGVGGAPLADGARVDGVTFSRPDLVLPRAAALLETAEALLGGDRPEMAATMRTISSLLQRLDTLLASPADNGAAADLRSILDDVRATVAGARTAIGDGQQVAAALTKLPRLLDHTDALESKLDAVDVQAISADLRIVLDVARQAASAVSASPLADPAAQRALVARTDETMKAITDVAARADRLLLIVEQGRGGLGKVFHDEALVDDLGVVLHQLRRNPMGLLFGADRKPE